MLLINYNQELVASWCCLHFTLISAYEADFTFCLSEDPKFPFPFQNHAANGMMEIRPLTCAKGPEGDRDCDAWILYPYISLMGNGKGKDSLNITY